MRIAIIGPGRLGAALAAVLRRDHDLFKRFADVALLSVPFPAIPTAEPQPRLSSVGASEDRERAACEGGQGIKDAIDAAGPARESPLSLRQCPHARSPRTGCRLEHLSGRTSRR